MYKNVASQSVTILAIDTATGLPKTGDASNITLYYNGDSGGVTVFSTSSGHPAEDDATNAPGCYTLALTQAETNYNRLNITGKSSTSGIRVIPILNIQTVAPNFNAFSLDSSGRVDAIKINSVSASSVTTINANLGTTQAVTFNANNFQKVSLNDILATTLTETSGQLAGGFKKWFNVATPTGTLNSIPDAVAGASGGLFIAGTNAATTVTTSFTTTFTGNLTGSVGSVTTVSDKTGYSLANGSFVTATFGTCDFTSTQKTSITTAATAATPTVTAGTVTDKTGYSLANGSFVTATFGTCDFTSTQKTSITTAATAATPTVTAGTVSDKTGYGLTSAYDFAKGTVAVTESYAANGVAPTPVQAILAIHQYLMDFVISSTSYTVKKLDDSTTAFIVTLNDATSPTGASRT